MHYNEKLGYTFAALTAGSGAIWLFAEYGGKIEKIQTKQIVSCVLVFWVVFLVRTVMTYVWGFGLPKQEAPLRQGANTVLKEEDEGEDEGARGATPARRRTRTRRDI